jgi:anti-sigma factor RsiW
VSARERIDLRLQAYYDGELRGLARWRFERRLTRDPAAQEEFRALQETGRLLREAEADAPSPDLWESIRLRLPVLDAQRIEAEERRAAPRSRFWSLSPWLGVGVAAAALALAIGIEWGDASGPGSVRWIDSRGASLMVLQDDSKATIIWVIEGDPGALSGRVVGRALI